MGWLLRGRGLRQRFSINFFQGPIFVLFSMGGPFDGIVICVLGEGYKQARIKCFVGPRLCICQYLSGAPPSVGA